MDKTSDKIKILLVDNDEMMRIYFRDIFWVHGRIDAYEVNMAETLKEAEEIINDKEKIPDIIFLDIFLSVEGEDNSNDEKIKRSKSFIKKIKENEDTSSIKIVIYSNHKDKSIEEEFNHLKVDGYLIKGELMPKEIITFTDKIHGITTNN